MGRMGGGGSGLYRLMRVDQESDDKMFTVCVLACVRVCVRSNIMVILQQTETYDFFLFQRTLCLFFLFLFLFDDVELSRRNVRGVPNPSQMRTFSICTSLSLKLTKAGIPFKVCVERADRVFTHHTFM
jgi:hypothetical protein